MEGRENRGAPSGFNYLARIASEGVFESFFGKEEEEQTKKRSAAKGRGSFS